MGTKKKTEPKQETRHGKIAEGSKRRPLLATDEQWRAWDEAAAQEGLLFSAWARRVLDDAARRRR